MFSQTVVVLLVSGLAGSVSAERERPFCQAATNCQEEYSTSKDFLFRVKGGQARVQILDVKYFVMCCDCNEENKPVAIDDPALPAMRRLVTVDRLIIRNCLPPGQPGASYASALAVLNVTTTQTLELEPIIRSLTRAHLTGLSITSLKISAMYPLTRGRAPAALSGGILDGLHKLRNLRLENMVLSPTDLKTLPTSLETLHLYGAQVSSAEWLERLSSLQSLELIEGVTEGGNLTFPPLASLPNLTKMSLNKIKLAKIEGMINGSALNKLSLDSCGLTTLPSNMFEGVNLTTLSLAGNNLRDLPNSVFSPLHSLTILDLSRNQLTASALHRTLPVLQNLKALIAEGNPLGSLCSSTTIVGRDTSQLPISLQTLLLRQTNQTRVCADWVLEAENLTTIDLTYNNIEVLVYTDLMMKRRNRSKVTLNLRGNRNLEVRMSCVDLDQCCGEALAPGSRAPVVLEMDGLIPDCRHTWLRAALKHCGALLSVHVITECGVSHPETFSAPPQDRLLEYEPYEPYCHYGACVPRCSSWKRAHPPSSPEPVASGSAP